MDTQNSTTQQVNNLIEFRQAIYQQAFRQERDAQFELLDALRVCIPNCDELSRFTRNMWQFTAFWKHVNSSPGQNVPAFN